MLNKMTHKYAIIGIGILLLLTAPALNVVAADPFIFGLLIVGDHNDHVRSRAFYEGGKYAEDKLPDTKMIYIEKVNPTDRPDISLPMLVDDMVEKGAQLIIASSSDMKDGILEAAKKHPDVDFIQIFGNSVLSGNAPKNLSDLVGRIEYAKMMAGFTAALTTKTGKIGYLGPLSNQETRLMAVSCYLGARYAWEKILKKDPKELKFQVSWIGYWFNIPGVTIDPIQTAQNFFNTGNDVLISDIETKEAILVAKQKNQEGKAVWAIPVDDIDACKDAAEVCLGVPFINWGPGYVKLLKAAKSDNWKSKWLSLEPDWKDINNHDMGTAGFVTGPALSADAQKQLTTFIKKLATKRINLFKGPLDYQDGSPFLKAGQTASVRQLWQMDQLLSGMTGPSQATTTE
ncbi:MAG: BMP family ABC transporter substrate-binding protein [Desulfobacterales bacterium]|jgi:simple sugar transport system substrate-binding protein